MNKTGLASIFVIALLLGGTYWYTNMSARGALSSTNQNSARKIIPGQGGLGTYGYQCDEHITFTLTIADEVSSLVMRPKDNPAYPSATVLTPIEKPSGKFGKWFSDNDRTLLIGRGESVTLQNKGSPPINCSPDANPDNAPWNWGD